MKKRTDNLAAPWVGELYDEEAPKLILYGKALGLSHGEAEDVLQETFEALLLIPHQPEQPRRYALRAYRYRVLNYRRSFWRRVTREWESRQWFEKGTVNLAAEKEALRCLAALPTEQREVVVLKIWHRLTFDEIGRLVSSSPNTAAGRYRYGLDKIRRQFNLNEDEAPKTTGTLPQWLPTVSPVTPDPDSTLRTR